MSIHRPTTLLALLVAISGAGCGDGTGMPDASSRRDAGSRDSGPRDAGTPDAGPRDAGPMLAPWRDPTFDGVPADVMVIGVYHSIYLADQVPTLAPYGFNTIVPYADQDASNTRIDAYLTAVEPTGIRIVLNPNPQFIRPDAGTAAPEMSAVRVTRYLDRPEILAWYLFDEPDGRGVDPAVARAAYDAIHAADPGRDIVMLFTQRLTLADVAMWSDAMDIYGVDVYPITPDSRALSAFLREAEEHAINAAGESAYWFVLQADVDPPDAVPTHALPTAAESRYMLYTVILAGADGVLWYRYYAGQSEPFFEGTLAPLVDELHGYAAAIRAGPTPVPSSNPLVQAALFRDPGSGAHLLIAAAHADTAQSCALDIPIPAARALGLQGASDLPITSGALDLDLPARSVAVYELDP